MGIDLVARLQSLGMEGLLWLLALQEPGVGTGEGKCSYCIQSYDTCDASALSFKGC